jgi:tetratricopeptide (TPR) repeat protein
MILDVSQLRSLRRSRGWDVSELARQLRRAAATAAVPSHTGLVRMIRRWESGSNGMSERYQLLCRRAFALSDLTAPGTAGGTAPPTLAQSAAVGEHHEAQRREFLTASAFMAAAGVLSAPPQIRLLSAGRRISADVPETLMQRLARLRRLDNYLGGSDTYHLYASELEATKTLNREAVCTENTRQQILATVSEQAQQAGWAAFDAGWQSTARLHFQESRDIARTVGNRTLESNAYALLAYQELTTGGPATALAEASCDAAGTGAPSRVRTLLHERRAWALAQTGSGPRPVRLALDRAAAALQEADDGRAPDWAAWVDANELQIMTGRCLTRTGQPRQAIAILSHALSQFDDAHARDKALYMTWLAEAYVDAGDIDAAADTADHVLTLSSGVSSVRPGERLRPILRRLSRHADTSAVANLLQRASSCYSC